MENWMLNGIGILIYFLSKYANRRNKTKKFSPKYWLHNNWPELTITTLINIALMMLLMRPDTTINLDAFFENYVPFGLVMAGKPTLSFALGLGLSWFVYKTFKSKTT